MIYKNFCNVLFAAFIGSVEPELVTNKGVVLSDIKIIPGNNLMVGKADWEYNARMTRKSGKHNSMRAKGKLYR